MTFPNAHALLIGVGSYADPSLTAVPITADDARAVAGVLSDPQYCGYPPDQVTLRCHAQASRAGILAALDSLAAQAGANATVFIFYAGHGAYGDDGYYLTTHDTQRVGGKVVSGTGVREAELIDKLRAITAQRLLLIVNACHAGEISPVLGADDAAPTGTPLPAPIGAALLSTGSGRVILTACREDQYAYIGPGRTTLFTRALLDGLQGKGVRSSNGFISLFDLYPYLYHTVGEAVLRLIPATTRQQYSAQQEPEITILKGVGPFAIARWQGATTLGDSDPNGSLPDDTAVREVSPAYSQAMLRQYQQRIIHSQVGAAVAGDNLGTINVTQQGDTTTSNTSIRTGNISGTGIAIGHGAQSIGRRINTGGGDYAEGTIDKRQGTFVGGDQFNMSGNVSGAMVTITTLLGQATQHLMAAPQLDAAMRVQVQALLTQLGTLLSQVPATHSADAAALAELASAAIGQATRAQPNPALVEISVAGVMHTAYRLAPVLPAVVPLAQQLADLLRR